MNPWQLLFQSRKFWLLLLDAVVSTVVMILNIVLSPAHLEIALALIAIYQPIFVAIITAIAKEDAATKSINGTVIKNPPELPPIG